MFSWAKIIGGSIKLFNNIADYFKTKQIRQDGKNEGNLEARVAQDESKKRADKIYNRDDDNVIKRMRDKNIPSKD